MVGRGRDGSDRSNCGVAATEAMAGRRTAATAVIVEVTKAVPLARVTTKTMALRAGTVAMAVTAMVGRAATATMSEVNVIKFVVLYHQFISL